LEGERRKPRKDRRCDDRSSLEKRGNSLNGNFFIHHLSLNPSGNVLFGASGKIAMIDLESDTRFFIGLADGA
jgi:hypothetical protein